MFQTNAVDKIKTQVLSLINVSSNRVVYEKMWKNMV